MLNLELQDKFATYLRESISETFGDKLKAFADGVQQRGILGQIAVHAAGNKVAANLDGRELLYNQKQLLKVAEQLSSDKPWIAYFAGIKHILFLRSKGITTASFTEFQDKEYSDEVERYAELIAVAAEGQLDSPTQEFLQELIRLQQAVPLVDQSVVGLKMLRDIPAKDRYVFLHPKADDRSPIRKLLAGHDAKKMIFGLSNLAITSAASTLEQNPDDWIMNPIETISYLQELKGRRQLLENTYLNLS